jgi:hypothetical protein
LIDHIFLLNLWDGRMKIAYLILAHNNYGHLKRLLNALNDSNVVFFIHINKRSKMPNTLNEFDNVVFIERINVWWAGWSQVDATIRLIRQAMIHHFDYYIYISGTDYPIRPNSFLYNKLSKGGEFIDIIEKLVEEKPELRIKYYYFDCFDRKDLINLKTVFFLLLERTCRLFVQKKTYPFKKIYYGSSWWALSHDCLGYVLDQIDNNRDYIRFFQTCWAPDESFFQTIIGNSPFFSNCQPNLTYVDWDSVPQPALINQKHIELFKKHSEFNKPYGIYTPFFARKFDDNSTNLIELIEKELRDDSFRFKYSNKNLNEKLKA